MIRSAARQVGDVAVDAAVQIETTLVGELQHDDGDERLGGAADVPRHVGIDGTARRVERRRADTRLADRAVRFAHRDPRADELSPRRGGRSRIAASCAWCAGSAATTVGDGAVGRRRRRSAVVPRSAEVPRSAVVPGWDWSELPTRALHVAARSPRRRSRWLMRRRRRRTSMPTCRAGHRRRRLRPQSRRPVGDGERVQRWR